MRSPHVYRRPERRPSRPEAMRVIVADWISKRRRLRRPRPTPTPILASSSSSPAVAA